MMRTKRPRATHEGSHSHSHNHNHNHGRTRAMSEDNMGDDHLLHMDPSLMTERQQLAFLLRTTAQEHSGGDSAGTHSSDSSDDDIEVRASKKSKKRIQKAKTSPRIARKSETTSEAGNEATAARPPATRRGPGRPPKNASKSHRPTIPKSSPRSRRLSEEDHHPASSSPKLSGAKRLHVMTSALSASDSDNDDSSPSSYAKVVEKIAVVKPSPSSTSDVAHMGVFEEHLNQGDFWSLHCALCSQAALPYEATSEPLFLCTSCDQKYPTQRSLGRV